MSFYRFESIIVEALWGYEKWMLSSLPGRESVLLSHLCNSAAKDIGAERKGAVTLNDLILKEKEQLLGKRVWEKYGADFPLLIKFIHTHDKLSVQVHPSDEQANRMNQKRIAETQPFRGKTEMWYITDTQPNASLLLGFSRKLSKVEFEKLVGESLRNGKKIAVEEFLTKFTPKQGDSFFVPAGTIHSLGSGLELFEIQQSSSTTFRLYDFNRLDKNGKMRRLDIDEALQSIDYSAVTGTDSNAVSGPATVTDASAVSDAVLSPATELITNKEAKTVAVSAKSEIYSEDKLNRYCKVRELAECEHFTTTAITLGGSDTKEQASSYILNLRELDSFSVIIATEGEGYVIYHRRTS